MTPKSLNAWKNNKDFWIDSLKVSDSLLIYESPKWILRYAQYDGVVDYHENSCGFAGFASESRNDEKIIDS